MNTEEKIKIMQAYVDGEIIQFRSLSHPNDPWSEVEHRYKDCDDLEWMWGDYEYRIKPKPRVVYCKELNGALEFRAFEDEDKGDAYCDTDWIKFVEVIE
jgi:hypothetical protein